MCGGGSSKLNLRKVDPVAAGATLGLLGGPVGVLAGAGAGKLVQEGAEMKKAQKRAERVATETMEAQKAQVELAREERDRLEEERKQAGAVAAANRKTKALKQGRPGRKSTSGRSGTLLSADSSVGSSGQTGGRSNRTLLGQ